MENLYLDTRDLISQQWCMAVCSHLSATQICFLQFHSFYNNLANRCDVKASRELCPADLALSSSRRVNVLRLARSIICPDAKLRLRIL